VPAAVPRTAANASVLDGTGAEPRQVGRQRRPVPLGPPLVGCVPVPDRLCALSVGSSLARGAAPRRRPAGAGVRSLGADVWPPARATDKTRAGGRGDNHGCGPHTRCAGSHPLLDAVRWEQASLRRDNATCHRAGGQSRVQRSDPVSRTGRALLVHSPARELASELPQGVVSSGPEQTPWSVPAPAGGDAPAPAAGSRPIG
jgi:hypothetical protein